MAKPMGVETRLQSYDRYLGGLGEEQAENAQSAK